MKNRGYAVVFPRKRCFPGMLKVVHDMKADPEGGSKPTLFSFRPLVPCLQQTNADLWL